MRAAKTASGLRIPSGLALAIALTPFVTMCLTVSLWDRVHPLVFGLPFNLFWLMLWTLLTSGCLAAAHRLEAARRARQRGPQ